MHMAFVLIFIDYFCFVLGRFQKQIKNKMVGSIFFIFMNTFKINWFIHDEISNLNWCHRVQNIQFRKSLQKLHKWFLYGLLYKLCFIENDPSHAVSSIYGIFHCL